MICRTCEVDMLEVGIGGGDSHVCPVCFREIVVWDDDEEWYEFDCDEDDSEP